MTNREKYAGFYHCYSGMKQRCYNPNNGGYKYYGGRGISICKEWMDSIQNFIKDMGERPDITYTVDRINSNGNYEPSNCRWATKKEQIQNRNIVKDLMFIEKCKQNYKIEIEKYSKIGDQVNCVVCSIPFVKLHRTHLFCCKFHLAKYHNLMRPDRTTKYRKSCMDKRRVTELIIACDTMLNLIEGIISPKDLRKFRAAIKKAKEQNILNIIIK